MHTNTTKTYLLGKFKSPIDSMSAVKATQEAGTPVFDVFSPFPIHGMDRLLGIKRSRLSVAAFFFGMAGTCTALLLMTYTLVFDWPMDIGGKPHFVGPAGVPITFELTVLFSAFGMVFSFFAVNKMFPGKQPTLLDPRVTDDVIVVAVDKDTTENAEDIYNLYKTHGAHEVEERMVHDEFFEM